MIVPQIDLMSSGVVSVSCDTPNSLREGEERFFASRLERKVHVPRVRHLSNVFVSHSGVVLSNGFLVDGCALNISGTEDINFRWDFWRHAIEECLVSKWGKSLSRETWDDRTYLIIHSKWFNYAFWINCYLSRLIRAEKEGLLKDAVLILPEGLSKVPYVSASLQAFDVETRILPAGVHLKVSRLLMPETRQYTATFYPPHLKDVRSRMLRFFSGSNSGSDKGKRRVYLSRSGRGLRCVENEQEVLQALQPFGFESVQFEQLSLKEQVMLMAQSEILIGWNGAGFTNMMFMEEGSHVVELVNTAHAELEYTFPFWRMANAMDLTYHALFCKCMGNFNPDIVFGKGPQHPPTAYAVNQNITVDVDRLVFLIQSMS